MRTFLKILLLAPITCCGQFKWPAHGGTLQDLINLNPPSATFSCDPCSEGGLEYDENEQIERNLRFWRERLSLTDSLHWYGKAKQAWFNSLQPAGRFSSSSTNTDWVEIGPLATMIGPSRGIGPVEFVAFHPTQSGYMLTGNTEGGLFYSSNSGANWQSAGTENVAGCSPGVKGAIFDFSDATAQTWFALNSGLGDLEAKSIFYEPGVLRTTDGGASYTNVFDHTDACLVSNCSVFTAHGSNTCSNPSVLLTKIIQDPSDANTLYLITNLGIYKTINGLASNPSWANITPSIPATLQTQLSTNFTQFVDIEPAVFVNDIEISPVNSQELFMSAQYFVYNLSASPKQVIEFWTVMQTTDGGCTWNEVPNMLNLPVCSGCNDYDVLKANHGDVNFFQNFNLVSIAFDPVNFSASNKLLYVLARDPNADATNNYQKQASVYKLDLSNSTSAQAIGLVEYAQSSSGEAFAVAGNYILSPAGVNSNVHKVTCTGGVCGTYIDGKHVDHEHIAFNPFNPLEVWISTHGGPVKVADISAFGGWVETLMVNGLGVAHCESLADSYSEEGFLLSGFNHMECAYTGTNYGSSGWGQVWTGIALGDGEKCLINTTDGKKCYSSVTSNGNAYNYNIPENLALTTTRYVNVPPQPPAYSPTPTLYKSDWSIQAVANQVKPDMIYFVNLSAHNGYSTVMRSFDWGTTIDGPMTASTFSTFVSSQSGYQIDPTLPAAVQCKILEAFVGNAPNYLYSHVIINQGNFTNSQYPERHLLFRTKKADDPSIITVQASWEYCPLPTEDRWLCAMTCDLKNPDIVTVLYSSNFTIANGGSTGAQMMYKVDYTDPSLFPGAAPPLANCPTGLCNDLTLNLPNTGSNSSGLAYEKGTDGGVYVSTDVGVFYTNNKLRASGQNWQLLGTGLPRVKANGIQLNYKTNKIRIGTYGRGVWEHDLYCPLDNDLILTSAINNEFDEAEHDLTSTANVGTNQVTYRAGNQVHLQPGFSSSGASTNFHAFIHGCDHAGNSFSRTTNLQAPNAQSMIAEDKPLASNELRVIPNPSNGQVLISVPYKPSPKNNVMVFDLRGNKVLDGRLESREEFLKLDLESGIYFIQYIDNGKVFTQRFVIAK